eukprot:m.25595 g.25595  ORF g.25595 m.25595 type:complete len:715 (+) comp28836_c0_seq3:162-2306(+)
MTIIRFVSVFLLIASCYAYEVTYDNRSILVNGSRVFLISGSIHYPRSTPGAWPDLMEKAKANGLNTLETYVFWNLHESKEGQYDFDGDKNLSHFLQLAQDKGLFVTLRIGPFIQAEWSFGGLPVWLNWKPGIEFRVFNDIWMEEMSRWMKYVVGYVQPYLAGNGGPIILTQIENEYHIGDMKYVAWCGELAKSLDVGVPWIMCNGASANNTINTCNSCDCDYYASHHAKVHPGQPLMWTELWQKHENWGNAQFERDPRAMAFIIMRWIARGGSHFNYYMWHGGNNFGRHAAAGITQFYQDNACLHSDGTTNEPKYTHLGTLHYLILKYSDILLNGKVSIVQVPFWNRNTSSWEKGPEQMAYEYTKAEVELTFLVNSESKWNSVGVLYKGENITMYNRSALLLGSSQTILYDSYTLPVITAFETFMAVSTNPLKWEAWYDTCNATTCHLLKSVPSAFPLEQINVTQDETDYLWYKTNLTVRKTGKLNLSVEMSSSNLMLAFVNGKLQDTFIDGSPQFKKLSASFMLDIPSEGTHLLELLSVSLGIHAGVSQNSFATKGIIGSVLLGGMNITEGHWIQQPFLLGEVLDIYSEQGVANADWDNNVSDYQGKPTTWFKTTFTANPAAGPVFVNATGLNQGHIYVNGHDIGRYWLVQGNCTHRYSCDVTYLDNACGQPTQALYHVPTDWLEPDKDNLLVVFEAMGATALDRIGIVQKLD